MKLDMELIEKLAGINRENIPERVMFAKGAGAIGKFFPYMSMADYTKAEFLQNPEKETPVLVRFSNGIGARGCADTLRNFRGFAARFYTESGAYDLMCSSLPVFFIKEPDKTMALIRALKPSPDTNLTDTNQFWEFIADNPETIHMLLWMFSDRGTLKSYRHMEGYSVNTYLWVSEKGEVSFIRYKWSPMAGVKTITRQEGEFLAGFDCDTASRDLYGALGQNENISYELSVQLVKTRDKYRYDFDLLDITKLWPEKLIPFMKIGRLTLTQQPQDYQKEVERVGFNPANTIEGISLSADPMLQMMKFACADAQRYRLGAVQGANSAPAENVLKYRSRDGDTREIYYKPDYYSQAGKFYRSLSDGEKNRLIDNLLESIMFVNDEIQEKIVGCLSAADEEFGAIVAMGLNF